MGYKIKKKFKKPYRIKKRKSIFRSRFFWYFVFVIFFCGGMLYFTLFSLTFQLKEIKISGNKEVSMEKIKQIIEEETDKKILFLSSKSIFLADLNEVQRILLETFPQIAEARFEKDFPGFITAEIEERKPVAIFYQGEQRFLIDKEGIAFNFVSDADSSIKIIIKNQSLADNLELGDEAIFWGKKFFK